MEQIEREKFADVQNQPEAKEENKEMENELANEEDKEKEVKPYHVFGSDFAVTQPAFITYYKYRMKMMVLKYKLVGKVDDNGQYIIPDLIKRDLIKMEKEIEDQNEIYYKAIALYMKKHFYYSVRIIQNDDGTAKASLFLSEFVDDFLGHEYIVSHVADYVDVYDDEFRIKLRKVFHLVDVGVKVDDMAVPELAVVMQDAFDFELVAGGLYDTACQIYLMSMLKELESAGPVGLELLEKYRALLAGKNIEIDEKFRYISYKALLDRIIDEYGGFEGIGLDPVKVQAIVMEMNRVLQQIDKASMRGPMEMQTTSSAAKARVGTAGKGKKSATKKAQSSSTNKKKVEKKKDATTKKETNGNEYIAPTEINSVDLGLGDIVSGIGEIITATLGGNLVDAIKEGVEKIVDFFAGETVDIDPTSRTVSNSRDDVNEKPSSKDDLFDIEADTPDDTNENDQVDVAELPSAEFDAVELSS